MCIWCTYIYVNFIVFRSIYEHSSHMYVRSGAHSKHKCIKQEFRQIWNGRFDLYTKQSGTSRRSENLSIEGI